MGGVKARSGGSDRRRRRQWPEAQKLRIVQESQQAGVVALEVCRGHGLHPSLLTKWRAQHREGLLGSEAEVGAGARLLPVQVHTRATPSREVRAAAALGAGRSGVIEVEFVTGRRLCIRGAVDAQVLRTVLQELSQS
ncbi:MAG: IS66-like element accessory protein TnpA [Steroidobacteraceae bacterium]